MNIIQKIIRNVPVRSFIPGAAGETLVQRANKATNVPDLATLLSNRFSALSVQGKNDIILKAIKCRLTPFGR